MMSSSTNLYNDPKPFRFKQFEVHHHLSTFKVNTDGVLLGCLSPLQENGKALDIGTGSGLISLMLAQINPNLSVLGIELDHSSAGQAAYSSSISPFADRVKIDQGNCFNYFYPDKYDLIVCNPPYFADSTLPNKSNLVQAKHSEGNFLKKLMPLASTLLAVNGRLAFLYPYSQDEKTVAIIEDNEVLYMAKKVFLKSFADSVPYAIVYEITNTMVTQNIEDQLVIYASKGQYSEAYRELTREFYL